MRKLHVDESLTLKTCDGPRLIVNLDAGKLHVNLGLNKVPLVVIEWHRGAECHINDAIANHEYKQKVVGRWKRKDDMESIYFLIQ